MQTIVQKRTKNIHQYIYLYTVHPRWQKREDKEIKYLES